MGDIIELSSGLDGSFTAVTGLISLVVLGLYALLQGENKNDDDDSSPGGGLMQPVGGAA